MESVADFGLVAVTTNYQIYFPTAQIFSGMVSSIM